MNLRLSIMNPQFVNHKRNLKAQAGVSVATMNTRHKPPRPPPMIMHPHAIL
jgi:hypothetical protein